MNIGPLYTIWHISKWSIVLDLLVTRLATNWENHSMATRSIFRTIRGWVSVVYFLTDSVFVSPTRFFLRFCLFFNLVDWLSEAISLETPNLHVSQSRTVLTRQSEAQLSRILRRKTIWGAGFSDWDYRSGARRPFSRNGLAKGIRLQSTNFERSPRSSEELAVTNTL